MEQPNDFSRPPRTARSRVASTFLAAVAAIALGACGKPPPEPEQGPRPVKIKIIGNTDPAATREYPGSIRAFQHADMGFEVAGRVTAFLVREGDFVDEGQVLAKIDPRDYQAQLDAAQADLRKAQSDLNRSLSIQKEDSGAISKETIDTHRREVDVAKAQLAVVEKGVEDTELRAPFAGVMARKLVEDFANVQAKEPVLTLQDNSVLEIEIDVPERDIVGARMDETKEQVSERVTPKVMVSALPDRQFPAWIKEYATTADPVTRTFAIRLNFDRPEDANILPGMTARVRIVTNPELAWSLPAFAALGDASGESYVWKVDPDSMQVSRAPVSLGDMAEATVRVTGGLEKGDQVAISGITYLRDGMTVRRLEN